MGIEPPFIYDRPSQYSFTGPTEKAFNPKAASYASWSSQPRPRPRSEGPLIDSKEFNRHPDSYFVVPYGNLDWKPMGPRTKLKVKYVRWLQFSLRLCALAGALGMLFCVICIKGVPDSTGWIVRVPPGIAILHTVYAIYHLARPAKGRTPTSSASYMLFAAIIDVGLIPFFVFTAMMARTQYTEPGNTGGHWGTLFGSAIANYEVVFSLFLISVVNGSIHLISLAIDIYLALIFRKISSLPPDMNPLEDNLTARHKRNKSSLLNNRSSPSTTSPHRDSRASDPLISSPRNVPFMHTRNDSHTNITDVPRPTSNPRVSQTDLQGQFYDQAISQRSSRATITQSITNNPSPYNQPYSQHSSRASLSSSPTKSTSSYNDRRPTPNALSADLNRSPTISSSVYSDSTARPPSTRPHSTVSDTNWIIHPSPPHSPVEFKHLRKTYTTVPQASPFDNENLLPRPLEMNPPTPPNAQWRSTQQRPLAPGSGNNGLAGGNVGSLGIGKARGYGNLGAGGTNMGGRPNTGGRVVSRSGVEVGRLDGARRGVRARDVSGKAAEEGRGMGKGMWGMAY